MANINWITVGLLVVSNLIMLYAWYGHLRSMSNAPVWMVIVVSWLIALAEYCVMIPANRIGFMDNGGPFNLVQLKVIQEAISLTVFTIIVTLMFKNQSFHWNHFVSFAFIVLAVFFAFVK